MTERTDLMNPTPTQSLHPGTGEKDVAQLSGNSGAEQLIAQSRAVLENLATLIPPWRRVGAIAQIRKLWTSQAELLPLFEETGLMEELEWNNKAAVAQLLGRTPPPRPSFSTAASSTSAACTVAAAESASAPATDPNSAHLAPAAAIAPADAASTSSSLAAATLLTPGSSQHRRRARRCRKTPTAQPEAKLVSTAAILPPEADVTSTSLVSRFDGVAAAPASQSRKHLVPRRLCHHLHDTQLAPRVKPSAAAPSAAASVSSTSVAPATSADLTAAAAKPAVVSASASVASSSVETSTPPPGPSRRRSRVCRHRTPLHAQPDSAAADAPTGADVTSLPLVSQLDTVAAATRESPPTAKDPVPSPVSYVGDEHAGLPSDAEHASPASDVGAEHAISASDGVIQAGPPSTIDAGTQPLPRVGIPSR
ncbi:uncharacterized protein V3H82_023744 [Fundulus diaphanus]